MKRKLKWIIAAIFGVVIFSSFLTQTIHNERILKREKARAQRLAEIFLSGTIIGDAEVLNMIGESDKWSDFRRGYYERKLTEIAEDMISSGVDREASLEFNEFAPIQQEDEIYWVFVAAIRYTDYQGIRINGMLIPDQEEEFITYCAYWNEENRIKIEIGEDREWKQ